ncbi:hypothetical protein KIW84_042849 [Lathyrus oleraceus]|uniref:Tf2-1-like SH3-like domain-containing protein n=1 Tax=Pisum sativum TaxID=3888 RepID=A0A9D4XDG4_PEA|nr:hypothetical protein KIW84_042849 [Pisum sativum]
MVKGLFSREKEKGTEKWKRIGEVAYRIALPPSLANLHEVFHVSQLRRYIPDPSHVVQIDDVQVRDNLTVETSPMRIEDRELKQLRGKEIALVKEVGIGRSRSRENHSRSGNLVSGHTRMALGNTRMRWSGTRMALGNTRMDEEDDVLNVIWPLLVRVWGSGTRSIRV